MAVLRYTCLISVLLLVCTWQAQAAEKAVELLQARRYAELEHTFQSLQSGFKRGSIDDEALLIAFRQFYDVKPKDLTARYDEWIAQFPKSYVAYLARGIHHKYHARKAQDGQFMRELNAARLNQLRRSEKLAAADFEHSLALDDRPLLSYMHAMDVSHYMSWRWSRDRLFAKANAIAPTNFIARRKHLLLMRARWSGGTVAEMQEFVQDSEKIGFTPKQVRELHNIIKEEQAWLARHRYNDRSGAEALYRSILDEEPDNVIAAESLIGLLSDRKQCAEVIELANRVLQQEPDNGKTISSRAYCYFHSGQDQLGIADYHSAADLGEPWAQKQLARHYWQGNLVPKDRDRALQLLRASAVQGDADAIREYERVTGESLPAARAAGGWEAVIKLALASLLITALVGAVVVRLHRSPEPGQLRHPPKTMIVGVLCVLFFGSMAIVSNIYHTGTIWTTLLFMGFAVMGLYSMASYLFGRHELTAGGIASRNLLMQKRYLAWKEVTSVRYSRHTRNFVLRSTDQCTAWISDQLLGLPVFARAVLDHVPPTAIDEDCRMIFGAILAYDLEEERDSAES